MPVSIKLISGRILLSVVAILTIVSPYIADWNATHIYNPLWPPHAKFHNAQTMAVAVLLGGSALYFLWRGHDRRADLLPAAVIASLYWVSQAIAFAFPQVAWTDPNLLMPGQALADFPLQLVLDAVFLAAIGLSSWLMMSGSANQHATSGRYHA